MILPGYTTSFRTARNADPEFAPQARDSGFAGDAPAPE